MTDTLYGMVDYNADLATQNLLRAHHAYEDDNSYDKAYRLRNKFIDFFKEVHVAKMTESQHQAVMQALPSLIQTQALHHFFRFSWELRRALYQLVTHEETRQRLLQSRDGLRHLLVFTFGQAHLCQKHGDANIAQELAAWLKTWTGKDVTHSDLPLPSDVIDCLYGTGTYALYFDVDAGYAAQLSTLNHLNLALQHEAPTAALPTGTALPEDLIL